MLAVDAGFAPNNRRSFAGHSFTVERYLLAVALHIELLDKFGQAVQVLVVRGDHMAAATVIVDIPHAYHGQEHRQVFFQRCIDKMLVHQMGAVEHFDKVFFAQIKHNRQADGRPQAVAAAHPIPKFKHIGRVDAEFGHGFFIGGHRHKMLGHGRFIVGVFQKPFARGERIGEGFLCGEGF